ncbi:MULTISPECIES: Rossmann-like domain-containing protein [Kosmotoga]|uniref:Heavy-metal chelation domain-containing protein n=1 Tax=Kosmotoga olearia (strain ATCC BAA-1733 / DSM 21960 / TBF 19.5.1) TaxID=521045 RepID=C5CI60_KOSOT|nr:MULTISPECIES: DUF364 domain-containing protein [Kosmotoga]ACR80762.1 protein of unknown function DUF364 [Kosmotoga olearia TBF 19.5.1]MDI3524504.1 uncharacterized protein [Kosmotoga sp.]MDK2953833.1 uncharacterized protein [Kosmotoga sp.]OAA19204.1 hypothetical protein DU53_11355 [Kosmotoga sp. DU53]
MNSVFDRVLEIAANKGKNLSVLDYVVGTGMTAVKLSSGNVGVAHLLRDELPSGCTLFDELFETPCTLPEFLKLGYIHHPITVSLALAAANALVNAELEEKSVSQSDIFEILNIQENDIVGFIGDFKPLTSKLKDKVKGLLIFERHSGEGYLPDWAIPWKLKECTAVIVTGTTMMNRTIDSILNSVNTDRVVVFGPSTPLVPEVYPDVVKAIGGARIVNPELAMKVASRAGGTKNLYRLKAAKKVTLIL